MASRAWRARLAMSGTSVAGCSISLGGFAALDSPSTPRGILPQDMVKVCSCGRRCARRASAPETGDGGRRVRCHEPASGRKMLRFSEDIPRRSGRAVTNRASPVSEVGQEGCMQPRDVPTPRAPTSPRGRSTSSTPVNARPRTSLAGQIPAWDRLSAMRVMRGTQQWRRVATGHADVRA